MSGQAALTPSTQAFRPDMAAGLFLTGRRSVATSVAAAWRRRCVRACLMSSSGKARRLSSRIAAVCRPTASAMPGSDRGGRTTCRWASITRWYPPGGVRRFPGTALPRRPPHARCPGPHPRLDAALDHARTPNVGGAPVLRNVPPGRGPPPRLAQRRYRRPGRHPAPRSRRPRRRGHGDAGNIVDQLDDSHLQPADAPRAVTGHCRALCAATDITLRIPLTSTLCSMSPSRTGRNGL